jgi:hypothetical protein
MSSWNHRVIKTQQDGADLFGVHEVYYDDAGELTGYVAEPAAVDGETTQEVREMLRSMDAALDLPVLTPADFPDEAADEEPVPEQMALTG